VKAVEMHAVKRTGRELDGEEPPLSRSEPVPNRDGRFGKGRPELDPHYQRKNR